MDTMQINQLNTLYDRLAELKKHYHVQQGKKVQIEESLVKEQQKETACLEAIEAIETKNLLIAKIGKQARQESSEFFRHLATSALQSVFGENTELLVLLDDDKPDKAAKLDFYIRSRYEQFVVENDPAEADGGGAADMVALVSLFTLNYLKREENKASILLDEPTKFLSKGKSEKSGQFIKEMSTYLGRQIIMTTHHQEMRQIADKGYELKVNDRGFSEIIETIDNEKGVNG